MLTSMLHMGGGMQFHTWGLLNISHAEGTHHTQITLADKDWHAAIFSSSVTFDLQGKKVEVEE